VEGPVDWVVKEAWHGLPINRPRPRPRKPVSPSTPEVLSIGALRYFGAADLTRPQVEDEDDDEDEHD
jgi:hypothetical protein